MKIAHMKMLTSKTFVLGVLMTSSVIFSAPVAVAAKAEEKVSIPATSEAIWQSIDKEIEQLAALIQNGKLEEVHHHAFAVRDLVAALPARSASLGADKMAQVKANTKFVDTLAERLDATGDAKDKAGTESNFQKLKTVLKTIRANYPGSSSK